MQMIPRRIGAAIDDPPAPLLQRVMALDDDAVDQMVCKRLILRSRIADDLISFTTGAAALSYFTNPDNPPVDLILLDVNMPRMNGFEFLTAARSILPEKAMPPVILMLSLPLGPNHRKSAMDHDTIKCHIPKPLQRLDLLHAVKMILPLQEASSGLG